MPLSSDQINQIINGQNQSSGGWGAAAMPTMAMPQGVGSNAIPTGAIAGRTAQGLLDSRNAQNYIGGLLGKYNPGQDSSALQLAAKQAAPPPPPAAAVAADPGPSMPGVFTWGDYTRMGQQQGQAAAWAALNAFNMQHYGSPLGPYA